MSWFFIALGAPFLWALVNIADQYLVKKTEETNSPIGSLVIFSSLIGIFVSIFILIVSKAPFLISFSDATILFVAGIVNIVWIIFYLYALSYEDVSLVYPWFLTVPIFAYILGHIFLGETLTKVQAMGMFIVILGGLLISLEPRELFSGKIKFKAKASFLMISAALLIAIQQIMFKFVTAPDTFWGASFWQYLGLGFSGVVIFIFSRNYRNGFLSILKDSGSKILTINIVSELVTIAGNSLFQFAILLAPVALVALMEPVQSVIVFVLAVVGTVFFPKIIKEDLSRKVLIYKIIAMNIMIFGSILILL